MESNTRFILVICNVFSNYAMFCHMDLNKTKDNIEVEILFWDIWEMFVNFGKMQALYIYVRGKLWCLEEYMKTKCSKYEYIGVSRRHSPLILVKEVYLDINERSQVFVLFLGLKILSSQRILWFTHFPSPPISFLCFAIYVRDIFGYLNSQPTCAGHWNRDLMKWSWNIWMAKTTSLIDNAMEPTTKPK